MKVNVNSFPHDNPPFCLAKSSTAAQVLQVALLPTSPKSFSPAAPSLLSTYSSENFALTKTEQHVNSPSSPRPKSAFTTAAHQTALIVRESILNSRPAVFTETQKWKQKLETEDTFSAPAFSSIVRLVMTQSNITDTRRQFLWWCFNWSREWILKPNPPLSSQLPFH